MTRRRADGTLAVTDELLLTYLARPEVIPPEDACIVERALHQRLLNEPRAAVEPDLVATMKDEDARENWAFLLAFRDLLIEHQTVEAAYLAIVRGSMTVPPLFLNQLVHLILRNALEGCEDPFVLRAAELFYRPQRVTVRDGVLLLADAELIEEREKAHHDSPLTAMFEGDALSELDVMDDSNAWTYWSRSDAHSMALNFGGNAKSRTGLAVAIAVFLQHLLKLETTVEPLSEVNDESFKWYVGLDAEATKIGDALWRGEEKVAGMDRMIGLFRLRIANLDAVDPRLADDPIYLMLVSSPGNEVRMKPQNLIVGLPLRSSVGGASW